MTLAPDVLMMDSGQYQVRALRFPRLDLGEQPADLVRVHPTYLAFAKLVSFVPLERPAWRINFASALLGAVAVANAALLAAGLTRRRAAVVLTVLVLLFGHTFWAYSVIAEVMTFQAAVLTAELLCWARYVDRRRAGWLMLLALLNGLGVAGHLQLGLNTFVHVAALLWLAARREIGLRTLPAWAGLWILGTLPYSAMVAWYGLQSGDWPAVLHSAVRGRYGPVGQGVDLPTVARGAAGVLLNYPTLLIVLAVPGAAALLRDAALRRVGGIIVVVAAIQFVFALTYHVPDQYSFFVPFYAVAAVLIGVGASGLLQRRAWRMALFGLAILPAAVYAAAPPILRARDVGIFARAVPYRDPYDFFIRPWKTGDYNQRRYVAEAFAALPDDAVLLCSETMVWMLRYGQQIDGLRPDVLVVDDPDALAENVAPAEDGSAAWSRPVFATDADAPDFPATIRERCAVERRGLLWSVGPPRGGFATGPGT